MSKKMENTTIFSGTSGQIETTAKLVIKEFVEVMRGFDCGMFIKSDSFMVGDYPLSIRVYPNGVEYDSYVGVFLHNDGDSAITVKGVLTTDLDTINWDTEEIQAGDKEGEDQFHTHDDCETAFQDKDFVVTAKLEVPGGIVKIAGNDSAASKKKNPNLLETVYNKMAYTDFTLVFEGEEIPCHKHILAAASPLLEDIMENKEKVAIESKANIKLSAEVGRAFVRFIYTGEVIEDVFKEHPSAFLELGEMCDFLELKNLAEKELLSQLKKENMVEMVALGELCRAEDIFEAAWKMTKTNMTWLQNQVHADAK